MPDKMDDAWASMIRNLEEKTGKPVAEWVAIARSAGDLKHGQVVALLKEKHGLGHGYANMVVHMAKGEAGPGAPPGDDLVAAQYAGDKAALKAIYDKLVKEVAKFGTDVEVSPKKAYVSLRRKKQFAILQPTTKTRLDVGINLKGTPAQGRLEASGSFNAMVTHRVRVESAADVDRKLIGWLKEAYEAAG
jgi:hypothetical protein